MDQLVLSQAVTKLGTSDWNAVATLLNQAPSTQQQIPYTPQVSHIHIKEGQTRRLTFNAFQFCETTFSSLLKDEGYSPYAHSRRPTASHTSLTSSLPSTTPLQPNGTPLPRPTSRARTANHSPPTAARPARTLAHKFYALRLEEIVKSLKDRETEAAKARHEITEIQSGSWDSRVLESVPDELRHEVITTPLPSHSPLPSTSSLHPPPPESIPDSDPPSRPSSSRSRAGGRSVKKGGAGLGKVGSEERREGEEDGAEGSGDGGTTVKDEDEEGSVGSKREASVPLVGNKKTTTRSRKPTAAAATAAAKSQSFSLSS
ncbi:hypothetical protein P7C70_g9172, partial [Phenoliferia sp. Uapishka_3]